MTRAKLGLALAGGGFRASLFHLGVLRRMAELDLLRYVQVLSTVSGGSIIGAHYILLLKLRLEDPKYKSDGPEKLHIPQHEYEVIVDELEAELIDGIRKNLRTRLLMNPLVLLKVLLLQPSLAAEMGRLYEKHIFGTAIAKLRKLAPKVMDRSGRILLSAIRLRKDQVNQNGGTEQYNAIALNQELDNARGGPGSAVTRLILNATSLNSGARFWFSHTEVGDWYLGHIRRDEIESELLPRKIIHDLSPDGRQELIDAWPNDASRNKCWHKLAEATLKRWGTGWLTDRAGPVMKWGEHREHKVQVEFVNWLALTNRERSVTAAPSPCFKPWMGTRHEDLKAGAELTLPWHGPLNPSEFLAFVRALLKTEAGRLRNAKNYAWYLAQGRRRRPLPITAGMDDGTLWMLFWDALKSIDEKHAQQLEGFFNGAQNSTGPVAEPGWCQQLLDSVLEVYYCQTAVAISPKIRDEWDALPLADTVAASAAFPPVFPPYQLHDLYDDLHVQVLSLTDGGPFDNIGVTALLDEHCNYVIASDTGAVFNTRQSKSAVGRLGMMRRLSNLLMNRPAQLYRHDLNERRRLGRAVEEDSASRAPSAVSPFAVDRELVAHIRTDLDVLGNVEMECLITERGQPGIAAEAGSGRSASGVPSAVSQFATARELKGLASFHIGSPRLTDGGPATVDPTLVSDLRTDLDLFGSIEIECLINEGYIMADQYLQAGLKGTPFDLAIRTEGASSWSPASNVPFPMNLDDDSVKERVEGILKAGKHRAFRALRLGAWLSVGATLVAVAGLLFAVWFNEWEWTHVKAAINWVVTKLLTWDYLIAWMQSIPLLHALLIVLVLLIIGLFLNKCLGPCAARFVQYMRREHPGMWRMVLTFGKNVKDFKWNALWLFKALPLTVLVMVPIACVSHCFFAKPFQWKTHDPEGLDRPKPSK